MVGLFFVIRTNYHRSITMKQEGTLYTITFNKDVNFLNKALLRNFLARVPDGSVLIIDGSKAEFVDHDILETIEDYLITSKERNIQVEKKLFVDISAKKTII